MTEPHPDDEALSAVLDGEGDDAERSHVEQCQACQARLDQLGAVSRAVGGPIPSPPAATIDAAVDRATAGAPPVPIRRVARRAGPDSEPAPARGRPRTLKWLAAAAVVVAVAAIGSVIAVTSNHHNQSHNSATSATAPPAKSAGAAEAAGAQTVPSPQAPADRSSPADLGDQSDPAALVTALMAIEKQGGAGSAATILSPPACAADAAAGAKLSPDSRAVLDAALRWQGKDAEVLVFPRVDKPTGQTAVVVAPADCSVLTSVDF